jgi:OmpR-family two-component system manganese-sensing response regulator
MFPTKRRILCVESHADTSLMLSTILGLLDYRIVRARTVAEGVGLARDQRFDLYLLGDRYLDGTNIDLCRQLRDFDPLTPIVIYSTATQAAERNQAMTEGAQEYVSKPGDIVELVERIRHLAEREETNARLAGV